jgi:hypothetical protein
LSSSPTLGSSTAEEEEQQPPVDHNPMTLGSPSTAVLPVPPIPDTNSESFLRTVASAIRSGIDLDGVDFSQFLDDQTTS